MLTISLSVCEQDIRSDPAHNPDPENGLIQITGLGL